MAFLSKKLVTLMCDAPVLLNFDHATHVEGVTPEFVALLRKLEFRTLLRQAEANLSPEEIMQAEAPGDELKPARSLAFTAADYQNDSPRIVALNPEGNALWVSIKFGQYSEVQFAEGVQAAHAAEGTQLGLLAGAEPTSEALRQTAASAASANAAAKSIDPTELLAALKALAAGPVIGHDLKSVFRALFACGHMWQAHIGHDTRIGAFLLNSLERSRTLSDLLVQPIDPQSPGKTIAAIWSAYEDQRLQLQELPKVSKLAEDIEFPTIYLLAVIEHRGILLDVPYLNDMSQKFAARIAEFEQKMYELAGQEFNISSPAQLAVILFEKLGLPTQGVKKGKTGYSTGANELDKLRGLHPIIDLITAYREYTKLKSTYIDALPKLVDTHGKLHTDFRLDVAATGRLSSADPNLQNIPTRTEIGQAIRTAFKPRPGYVFVSADYSQFELRLAAALASDKQMIEDFNKDIDIHTAIAAQVYGVPLAEVTKEQRRRAKVVNFGILYGMSPHGLSVATGMDVHEAKQFIDRYFELRAPIKAYMERVATDALHNGYVETLFGRRRPTPDMKSSNFIVRESAKRAAINMPIQGTEADLMKLAMLKIETAIAGLGEQLLQIHDSILVECPQVNAATVADIVKNTMESIYPDLPVKLKVDVSIGANWGDI